MRFLGHPQVCWWTELEVMLADSKVTVSGRSSRSETENFVVELLISVSCTGPVDRDPVSSVHADFPVRNACSLGLARIVAETR